MSVQFETVKENTPKGIKVHNRSSDENFVSFALQKRGMNMAFSGLGIPIFLVGLFSCTVIAGPSVDNGYLDAGSGITLGLIVGIAAMGLCIYLIARLFTQKVTLRVTSELIEINEKKYDPKLFKGFISGQQSTEWLNNRHANVVTEETITGLAWIYGGERVALKGGFNTADPSDAIRYLNRLVTDIHPT